MLHNYPLHKLCVVDQDELRVMGAQAVQCCLQHAYVATPDTDTSEVEVWGTTYVGNCFAC